MQGKCYAAALYLYLSSTFCVKNNEEQCVRKRSGPKAIRKRRRSKVCEVWFLRKFHCSRMCMNCTHIAYLQIGWNMFSCSGQEISALRFLNILWREVFLSLGTWIFMLFHVQFRRHIPPGCCCCFLFHPFVLFLRPPIKLLILMAIFFLSLSHFRIFNQKSKHIVWYTIVWMERAENYWVR